MDCYEFPKGFPKDLMKLLPLRIGVSFTLTEWTSVNQALYKEHEVGSVQDAVTHLVRGQEIFLIYRFYSETVTPAWANTVDWPLRRRGKTNGAVADRINQGEDIERSNMLFELRNKPLRPYESRLMLKTGGRTIAEACERWGQLAIAIRQQLKTL